MKSQRDKFVIAEIFSNSDGKTSGSGFVGVMIGVVGCLGFLVAIVGYLFNMPNTVEVMRETTMFIGASSILLATRKVSGRIGSGVQDVQDQPDNNDSASAQDISVKQ